MRTQPHRQTHIINVALTDANTEYSAELPDGTLGFVVQSRNDAADVRIAFQANRVANASTGTYFTVKGDLSPYREENILSGLPRSIFLASGTAGAVVEILYWH